jgi:HD-like signal output (HDOD) protein
MIKVLVIDNDADTRRTLQGLFSEPQFQVVAVEHGVDAIIEMADELPDLILIDQGISMGGIKTAQIIHLSQKYAHIPILLGIKPGAPEHTKEILSQAIHNGIAWVLARPYKPERLLEKVREVLTQHAKQNEKPLSPEEVSVKMRKQIRTLTDLPALSTSQTRLMTMMSCDDTDINMDELIEAIQSDQALALRTLRIARSACYGYQGNMLHSAVTFLGVQNIRQIVQSATVLDVFGDEGSDTGLDIKAFWAHSIACGMVIQMISRDNLKSKHFMAGLLHDMGRLALDLKFAPYSKLIGTIAEKEKHPRHVIEQELIGISHAEVGFELATLWDLPHELCVAIGFHHMPSATQQHKLVTALVYISDVMVRRMGIGNSGNFAQPIIEDPIALKLKLPMTFEDIADHKEEIVQQVDAIVSLN